MKAPESESRFVRVSSVAGDLLAGAPEVLLLAHWHQLGPMGCSSQGDHPEVRRQRRAPTSLLAPPRLRPLGMGSPGEAGRGQQPGGGVDDGAGCFLKVCTNESTLGSNAILY